jgi:hypothetical protein
LEWSADRGGRTALSETDGGVCLAHPQRTSASGFRVYARRGCARRAICLRCMGRAASSVGKSTTARRGRRQNRSAERKPLRLGAAALQPLSSYPMPASSGVGITGYTPYERRVKRPLPPGVGAEQPLNFRRGRRVREQVALRVLAADLAQGRKLPVRLTPSATAATPMLLASSQTMRMSCRGWARCASG